MKALTYNMHKGRSFFLRKYAVDDIKQALKNTNAEIIFLQEMHGEHPKKFKETFDHNPLEQLAEDIWPNHTYGKNAVYKENHHGNAILSKYPILFSENIDISETNLASRGLLHAVIDHPERQFHALCTHFDLFESARQRQFKLVCGRIASHIGNDETIILAGDFNDWQNLINLKKNPDIFLYESSRLKTFPSLFPLFSLDRFYFRGLEIINSNVLSGPDWVWLSDHLPLLAEFKFVETAFQK